MAFRSTGIYVYNNNELVYVADSFRDADKIADLMNLLDLKSIGGYRHPSVIDTRYDVEYKPARAKEK